MNKLEIINALRDEVQISKKEAAAVVDLFFNEMANVLAEGALSRSLSLSLSLSLSVSLYVCFYLTN